LANLESKSLVTLKPAVIFTIGIIAASAGFAQGDAPRPVVSIDGTNLPVQRIGKEDLLSVTVYDSPELTHTYRLTAIFGCPC
jgi:hypothetical protein